MVVRTRLSQFQSSVLLTPVQAIGTTVAPALFPCNGQNADGTTTAGADGYLGSTKFYNLVDALGNRLVQGVGIISSVFTPHAAVQYRNFVRYCENPGDRLFSHVAFNVNGNPLDEYNSIVPVMLHKFCLAPNKVAGYNRLIGQENPRDGFGGLTRGLVVDADVTTAGVANTPAGINLALQGHGDGVFNNPPPGAVVVPPPQPANPTQPTNSLASDYQPDPAWPGGPLPPFGTFNPASNVLPFATLNSTPAPVVDYSMTQFRVTDGPQTPKPAQPPLEIWNKLRFWFNEDVRLAIASVSIPFGQRFITVELASADLLAFEFCNLYLETVVDIVAAPTPVGPPFYPTVNVSQHRITYTPIAQQGVPDGPSVERMELYVNNIFVNPEVHDIFIKRIGFSLIRVYRQQETRITNSGSGEILLSQLKWPIEYMMVGFRPAWNIARTAVGANGVINQGNQQQWRDWDRMTKLVDVVTDRITKAAISQSSTMNTSGTSGISTSLMTPGATSAIGQIVRDSYPIPVPSIDTLTLTAHGITIYDSFQDIMYNSYLPNTYGGAALNTPDDTGAMFINFALFPRSYQPSGHLNISRARETYLRWTTSYISPTSQVDMLCVGTAINFLLITDKEPQALSILSVTGNIEFARILAL